MKLSSGDKCPKCGKARLRIRTSWQAGEYQKQKLDCPQCDYKHEQQTVVPASQVRRRLPV